jgi:hypothetical protein
MSFFKKIFESEEEEKERLELERRMRRRAEEAAEAAGLEELPTVIDHNAEGHARADAADAAREAAAERAAEIADAAREAEAAYAAEIAAEIPEAQKAIQLLTEYWKNMNEYKARHMNADGRLLGYSIQEDRPNKNWQKVHDACQAAAAAYRYKYEHSQDMEEKKLFEKKFYKYQSYGDDVYMLSMRHHDHDIGMYNVQLGKFPSIWTSNGGKKSKSKYSRKSKSKYSRKSKSKYSRKSRTKYSRKSRSRYSRKY